MKVESHVHCEVCTQIASLQLQNQRLRALVDVLRPNAHRYLWLRRQPKESVLDVTYWISRALRASNGISLRGVALDATIDDHMDGETCQADLMN